MHRPWILACLALLAFGCSSAAEPTPIEPSSPSLAPAPPSASRSPQPTTTAATATASPVMSPDPVESMAWLELDPSNSPSAREDHTWTVDPTTRIAYLFGGRDGGDVRGDLWAYNLATDAWQRVEPGGTGPRARFGHEAVWVDGVGLVVWAGQAGPTTFFDDLWAYDPSTNAWSRLPNDGARPLARYGSCSAVGPDGRLWISHGFTAEGSRFADTRAYDFATGRWTDETPDGRVPVERCLHACWFTADDRLALYAGQTTGVQALGDLWALDRPGAADAAWAAQEGQLPDDRQLYAVASWEDGVVVFGGRGLGSTYHRDVWAVDGTTLAFQELQPDGARPPARAGATLVADPAAIRAILFGGTSASRAFADTWELTLP